MKNKLPSARHKRVSKRKKSAWRIHCDTKDVDSFLEDKRHEERTGIIVSELEDKDLFLIDKNPCKETKKGQVNYVATKPPRCFEILTAYSAVRDPLKQRNRVKTVEERRHPIANKKESDRKAKGILKAKELSAIKSRILNDKRKANKDKKYEFNVDLWGSGDNDVKNDLDIDVQWLNPTTLKHTLKNTGQFKKSVPQCLLKKTSNLPSIETPHPGVSYNPSYSDHQQLLNEVASKEIELVKEEKHLNRVTTNMFSRVTPSEKIGLWMNEMSEGMTQMKTEETKEVVKENENNGICKSVNAPVKDKKKTRQQRRKQRLLKEEEQKRKLAKIEKKKIADIYKLKNIEQQLQKKETILLKRKEALKQKKESKKMETKKLSKNKFEKAELDFTLPSDLAGTLRCLKPEGNLLKDRFKSLQQRNLIEATVMQGLAKKVKRKVYTKNSHK